VIKGVFHIARTSAAVKQRPSTWRQCSGIAPLRIALVAGGAPDMRQD